MTHKKKQQRSYRSSIYSWNILVLIKALLLLFWGMAMKISPLTPASLKVSMIVMGMGLLVSWILIVTVPNLRDRILGLRVVIASRKVYAPFLISCFALTLWLGLYMTQSGSGISPDSTNYISVAENLNSGKGFITSIEDIEYTIAGPVYILAIAVFNKLGMSAELAGKLIPLLSLAGVIVTIFFIAVEIGSPITGYVSCLASMAFSPLLLLSSYTWTETPYIFFSSVGVLFLIKYMKHTTFIFLGIAGIFTALAFATRYAGLALLLAGLVLIVVKNWLKLKTIAGHCFVYGAISCLIVVPWLYRNMSLTGDIRGAGWSSNPASLASQFASIINIVTSDFLSQIPQTLALGQQYGLGFLIGTVIVYFGTSIALSLQDDWWQVYLKDKLAIILYPIIYIVLLAVSFALWAGESMSYRFLAVIYPFIVLIAFSMVFHSLMKIKSAAMLMIVGVICLIVVGSYAFHGLNFAKWASQGQAYTSAYWRNSQLLQWAEKHIPQDSIIYTNMPDVTVYRLKESSHWLPVSENKTVPPYLAVFPTLEQLQAKWNAESNFYILNFHGDISREGFVTDKEIAQFANGELEAISFPEGVVYKGRN